MLLFGIFDMEEWWTPQLCSRHTMLKTLLSRGNDPRSFALIADSISGLSFFAAFSARNYVLPRDAELPIFFLR